MQSMREIKDIKEIQKIELNILKYFKSVCVANGLRYYMAFGTLIGCVRHKGFIPWDDDIDVFMPYSDYLKLVQIFKNSDQKKYKLVSYETDDRYTAALPKIIDTDTHLIQNYGFVEKVDGNPDFWNVLDELVSKSEIVIDRPKGSAHSRFPDFIYRVDYGYLKDTSSMDGAGIDVWVGSGEKTVDAVMCIVDLMKRDSEIKLLIGCTEEEKQIVYETHNESRYMKGIMIRR